ncbi:MAG: carboxylesterase/lipase family protein, partial [Bacteroidales bacterium]|nr:carboxylesterase/lipase family protein [Bacteroidales bacterium]
MHTFSRRQFLKSSFAISGSLLLLPSCGSPKKDEAGNKYVVAKTTYGNVRGIRQDGVNIFKGIPYAGSVYGQYRFARPATLEEWPGVRDALRLGTPAMQLKSSVYGIDEPDPGEDCLFLNIWTPANDNAKRPVMFYNHGGGYATGSGGSVAQDGANLARYFDVVVVETNHRLNIFGYLYLGEIAGNDYKSSGNNGLLDIVDGLKWVHENIAEFGGDPNNVTLFGQSGGGHKIRTLLQMPAADGLYNKVIFQSGLMNSAGGEEASTKANRTIAAKMVDNLGLTTETIEDIKKF